MTQAALAKSLGYSAPTTISLWENDKGKPDADTMRKLEKRFGAFNAPSTDENENQSENAFANWLSTERSGQGLTKKELAERSGVNALTIALIEDGKIQRPQQRTLAKLEKGLGVDHVAEPELKEDTQTDERLGRFEQFNPWEEDEWPDFAGVYVLYDATDRPVYVGISGCIRDRLRIHNDHKWYVKPFVTKGAYIRVDGAGLRKSLESILIKFMLSNALINKKEKEGAKG